MSHFYDTYTYIEEIIILYRNLADRQIVHGGIQAQNAAPLRHTKQQIQIYIYSFIVIIKRFVEDRLAINERDQLCLQC
jgi:hypothetical protein